MENLFFENIKNNQLIWNEMPISKKKLFSTVGSKGPTSLHSYCDWSIGCRLTNWGRISKNSCWGNPYILPKIIFISCKSFKLFYSKIYPYFPADHKYVIIIADEDCSIPNNSLDVRYKRQVDKYMWDEIVNNKNICHIFATHLDIEASDRYSPLPVGLNPTEHIGNNIDTLLDVNVNSDIMNRELKVIGCFRTRKGRQWNDRSLVKDLMNTKWNSFSEYINIDRKKYFNYIQKYSFIFCPHGGGIDPNPTAFSAIYCCTIPIIKKFVNCEIIYKNLPVIFIEDWSEEYINVKKLEEWRYSLKSYFYDVNKRNNVLEILSSKFWLNKIQEKII